jgi:peptidoglycan/LPS O-acetylase OafA/YrhL
MSYSLYLVHQPVVQALAHLLRVNAGLSSNAAFIVLIASLPLILFFAWLLFVSVERYTLTSSGEAGRPWWEALASSTASGIWRPVLAVTAITGARK